MRNMSFAITTPQAYTQLKTVTRRLGWWKLKPDQQVQQVEKGMGLKKGERIQKIHVIRIKDATPEPLYRMIEDKDYGRQEVIREGFPWMTPEMFVDMFCATHKGCTPQTEINRIEFSYMEHQPVPICSCGRFGWRWQDNNSIVCHWCGRHFTEEYPELKGAGRLV